PEYQPRSRISHLLKDHFEEIFGFLLLREYRYEKAFMFIGTSNGRNGKSKLMELIRHFIGKNNYCSLSLQNLDEKDFSLSELFNKLANIGGDLPDARIEETGTFKKLTGRDSINAKRKFLPDVSFINFAKLIFSTNKVPTVYDSSEAFFNRWILLDFPFRFLDKDEYEIEKKTNPN
ncbi:MAG: DUF5906 domain-containing protein, partial [Candidatus Thorarchaeota archaeon]